VDAPVVVDADALGDDDELAVVDGAELLVVEEEEEAVALPVEDVDEELPDAPACS
jgi:hypothetical protein